MFTRASNSASDAHQQKHTDITCHGGPRNVISVLQKGSTDQLYIHVHPNIHGVNEMSFQAWTAEKTNIFKEKTCSTPVQPVHFHYSSIPFISFSDVSFEHQTDHAKWCPIVS